MMFITGGSKRKALCKAQPGSARQKKNIFYPLPGERGEAVFCGPEYQPVIGFFGVEVLVQQKIDMKQT